MYHQGLFFKALLWGAVSHASLPGLCCSRWCCAQTSPGGLALSHELLCFFLGNPPLPPPSLSPCSPKSQMWATVRVLPTGLGLRDLFQCPLDIACWWEPCLFRASGPRWSYFPGHQIRSLTQTQILGVLLSAMTDPEQVTGKQQFTG